MSMFGDSSRKEPIYEELKYIYGERYEPDEELAFVVDVLEVLTTMFGEW